MIKITTADDVYVMYEPSENQYYIKLKGTTLDKPINLTIAMSRFEFMKVVDSLLYFQKEKHT